MSLKGKKILDACCGPRMFWFDRSHPAAVFVDKRREQHVADTCEGRRHIVIDPDILACFTKLPFEDETFSLVVFDPPHLKWSGKKSWLVKKYGRLERGWEDEMRKGFLECFRVLKPDGTLIFKWSEHEIPVSRVLELAPAPPLFGNRCGKSMNSHWLVFMKEPIEKAVAVADNLNGQCSLK